MILISRQLHLIPICQAKGISIDYNLHALNWKRKHKLLWLYFCALIWIHTAKILLARCIRNYMHLRINVECWFLFIYVFYIIFSPLSAQPQPANDILIKTSDLVALCQLMLQPQMVRDFSTSADRKELLVITENEIGDFYTSLFSSSCSSLRLNPEFEIFSLVPRFRLRSNVEERRFIYSNWAIQITSGVVERERAHHANIAMIVFILLVETSSAER